jgi:hypothetical protein
MNNEPVAWMSQGGDVSRSADCFKEMGFTDLIPLYTHPLKELTNEEILCLWDWWSGEVLATNIIDFADTYKRALLGEKGLVEWHKKYVEKMNNEDPSRKATQE